MENGRRFYGSMKTGIVWKTLIYTNWLIELAMQFMKSMHSMSSIGGQFIFWKSSVTNVNIVFIAQMKHHTTIEDSVPVKSWNKIWSIFTEDFLPKMERRTVSILRILQLPDVIFQSLQNTNNLQVFGSLQFKYLPSSGNNQYVFTEY